MPTDQSQRESRHRVLREILSEGAALGQRQILEELARRGFVVTQASVSRDLRALHAAKINGRYVLANHEKDEESPAATGASYDAVLRGLLRASVLGFKAAGPHLVVVKTVTGAASAVALAIDQAAFAEIAGTVAGDDTVFIATPGKKSGRRLEQKLQDLMEGASTHA